MTAHSPSEDGRVAETIEAQAQRMILELRDAGYREGASGGHDIQSVEQANRSMENLLSFFRTSFADRPREEDGTTPDAWAIVDFDEGRNFVTCVSVSRESLDEAVSHFPHAHYRVVPLYRRSVALQDESEPTRYDQIPKGCWVAVLAGLTGIPHEEFIPLVPVEDFSGDDRVCVERWRMYHDGVCDLLASHGWTYVKCGPNAPRGFAMGIGRSSRGVDHSVITLDGKLWHDPHPSREGVASFKSFELPVRIVVSASAGEEEK